MSGAKYGFKPTFGHSARSTKNECARGGQAPGTAPPDPLETEWHAMMFHDPAAPGKTDPPKYPPAYARVIPTSYRGCRFRSRLEARWAVFFDRMDIGWMYEPEGFVVDGRPYLPDFLLECGTWVEVKGPADMLSKSLMRKAAVELPKMPASREAGPRLLVLGDMPIPYAPAVEMSGDWAWLGLDPDEREGVQLHGYGLGNFAKNRRPWWLEERTGDGNWLHPSFHEWEINTADDYAAALGARFEFGESGAR